MCCNQARALQYCLEEDNNILEDDAWIVHLDEETLLTEASVRGIMNFITADKHSFGQGMFIIPPTSSYWLHFQNYLLSLIWRISRISLTSLAFNEMSGKIYLHSPGALWDNSGWEISF